MRPHDSSKGRLSPILWHISTSTRSEERTALNPGRGNVFSLNMEVQDRLVVGWAHYGPCIRVALIVVLFCAVYKGGFVHQGS